jgi:hypothetical protein
MAAADMVGRLLERYALSRTRSRYAPLAASKPRCHLVAAGDGRSMAACRRSPRFCDCKVWLARSPAPDPRQPDFARMQSASRYVFFGFETDSVRRD